MVQFCYLLDSPIQMRLLSGQLLLMQGSYPKGTKEKFSSKNRGRNSLLNDENRVGSYKGSVGTNMLDRSSVGRSNQCQTKLLC